MSFLPPKVITGTLAVGASRSYDGPGSFARLVETTGALRIGFDLGAPMPNCQVGQAFKTRPSESFSRVTIENPETAAGPVTFTMVVGDVEIIDDRVHISTATVMPVSQSDPNFAVGATMDTSLETNAAAAGVLLVPADATRREVWLWTDEATNQAWFAESVARLAAPLAFQQIGMTLEGFTKLRTKAAIYVKAANGVKVGAISFKA